MANLQSGHVVHVSDEFISIETGEALVTLRRRRHGEHVVPRVDMRVDFQREGDQCWYLREFAVVLRTVSGDEAAEYRALLHGVG